MSELHRCAYCGGSASIREWGHTIWLLPVVEGFVVACDNIDCGSGGQKCKTEELAIAVWNRVNGDSPPTTAANGSNKKVKAK